MSTSLLYHGLGIRGYRYVRTLYEEGGVVFVIDQARKNYRCSHCGSDRVTSRGRKRRRWRVVPFGRKPVFVEFAVPRLHCWSCHRTRQAAVPFAEPKKHYTRAFARYVLELSRSMTIQDVADHLGISWDTVKEIQRKYLKAHFAKPKLKQLKQIAIDEISIGKGHRYVTVVLDLESGAVVFVGQGKSAQTLDPFWVRLRASHAKIQAVATDMSPAYIAAIVENLPDAVHVFDRFHVVKLFNEELSELRRELYREATDLLQKKVLKGTRWLLLKNPENLDDEKDESKRLKEALALNTSLAAAYYLKEDLRQFWRQKTYLKAARFLDRWCQRAEATGIRRMQKLANTIRGHRTGLLNWYVYPISTGPLEGTNTKLRAMQRQSYGFRDKEFFYLKIYQLHETKHALVG
ncbi:MAG TPA: ISL3 family transposase [Pirellulaceae bacterium]|nr:ISL3 family transposase [Pirellulaceae bacterium]